MLNRLQTNNLKINLHKCFFDNNEVSYLGFTLTPEGIKPGKNKLKAYKDIRNFAIIAAPLFRLTRKDSGYKGGPLPKEAMDAFCILKKLTSFRTSYDISSGRLPICIHN